MMKKKMKEHLDEQLENIDKPTENKEYTGNPEVNNTDSARNDGSASSGQNNNGGTGDGSAETDKVLAAVRAVEEKLAEMQDRYIRLSAEFDNYRKRTLREKMDLSKYAGENLLLGIIPVIDDFERALWHMDVTPECSAMKDGIDIIYGKFIEFLKQNGVKEIEALNKNFDVDLHEAVAKVQVDDPDKKGKVVDVLQKGYYLQDKVLRFSKVVVGE